MTDKKENSTPRPVKAPEKIGAVAVVGGGIAGMQSALDLARTGFKVYLLEQNTSIGGVMAQLDKTFPTNDCSTCMISPKLIEVAANPNIDIITGATVRSLAGEPGRFSLEVELKPRYLDVHKCTACGECAKVCPASLSAPFDEGLGLRRAAYRHFPQAIPSAYAIDKLDRAPCVRSCPANLSAQGYVQLIKAQKYPEALALIMDRLPLPGTIGRICPHPCESDCRRQEIDEPVAICNLKRFAADQVDWQTLPVPEVEKRNEAVAIVGAGPSGLSCAYHLVRKGYRAVIFEAAAEAGGWLRYGIPEYRLPRQVLQQEVNYLKRLGVEFRFQNPIGPGRTVNDLLTRDGFRAVFLGVGCQDSLRLPVPGAEAQGVLWGVEYLKKAASTGANPVKGKRTLVIGGGNVAIDVARTARRQDAFKVTIVCLESREEMPASPWEVKEAEAEGIEIVTRWGVKQIIASVGKVSQIELKAVARVFDEEGRFAPTYFEDRTTTRSADVVIVAIGQKANLEFLTPEDGIELTPRGLIKSDPETLATGREGVFAGGDGVSGPYIAIAAVAAGREAAISVDRYLNGQDLREGREKPLRPIPKEEGLWCEIREDAAKQARALMSHTLAAEWTKDFQEINLGYAEAEAVAEADRCLNCGLCSECLQCAAACQAGAIDHSQQPRTLTLEVGAVILTLGFRPFDAGRKGEYGYGRYPNVITSLEFERMLSASGPFRGHIQRPADAKDPVKVAWIQCVGSRDAAIGQNYCSSVCCMYAVKQSIIAKEHDHRIEPSIFFMDLRAHGKGFDRYYERAKNDHGVRFVRSMISRVTENPLTHDLGIHYLDEAGQFQDETFDLVILSVGIKPHPAGVAAARKMNLELDRFNFARHQPFDLISTSREGIFAAGVFQTPKDIPETVAQASSAACQAQQLLSEARGTLISAIKYPPERLVVGEEPRIGVFVCHCGINIGGVIDVPSVAAYAKTLPHVVYTSDYLFTCSTDAQARMMDIIKEYQLNRVVVASCSPRTHEALFQDNLRKAGLNKYLFDMANIRDQCSWVHQQEPQAATEKAKDLVRMSVSRAAQLQPLAELPVPVTQKGLVIGGGAAGLTAALALADQGFPTTLVEKSDTLGGEAARLFFNARGEQVQPFLQDLIRRVENHPAITLFTLAEVLDTRGHVGKFVTRVEVDGQIREVEHGATIIATGGSEFRPTEYLYDQHPQVWTQREFHGFLEAKDKRLQQIDSLVMIQCVGSREPEHPYCSRICCTQAVTNALRFKEMNPGAAIYVLYRDIRTFGLNELYYQQARQAGVLFVRFDPDQKPQVRANGEALLINVFDQNMRAELEIPASALVLSAAIRPRPEGKALAGALKLPLDQDGFFLEAHVKLRPLDFTSSGYFLCGLGHGPKFLEESLAQAQGAASRAATILAQEKMYVGGQVAQVDREKCVVCLTCARTCPFRVPKVAEDGFIDINPAECHGCGNCASACPRGLIQVQHMRDEQILAETLVVWPWDKLLDDLQSEVAG